MNKAAQNKLLAATRGSQLGAIIRCALGVERDAEPRFEGKATVTSDGFIMCNFIDRNGDGHWGAFVGSHSDYAANVHGVADHCRMNTKDRVYFFAKMSEWCDLNRSHIARRMS